MRGFLSSQVRPAAAIQLGQSSMRLREAIRVVSDRSTFGPSRSATAGVQTARRCGVNSGTRVMSGDSYGRMLSAMSRSAHPASTLSIPVSNSTEMSGYCCENASSRGMSQGFAHV